MMYNFRKQASQIFFQQLTAFMVNTFTALIVSTDRTKLTLDLFLSFLFLKFLLDTCPFVGPLIPQFWTSPLGFKARANSALFKLCGGKYDIHSLRFTSGATPLLVYNASIAASRFPNMHVSAEVGCWDLNHRPPARQSDALLTQPRRFLILGQCMQYLIPKISPL